MSKQITNTVVVLEFLDQEKAQLPSRRITEQPVLLTKNKINRPGYKFCNYNVTKIRQSNLILILVLVLESEGPYH